NLNIGIANASNHDYTIENFGRVNLNAGITPGASDVFDVSGNGMVSASNDADMAGYDFAALESGGNVVVGGAGSVTVVHNAYNTGVGFTHGSAAQNLPENASLYWGIGADGASGMILGATTPWLGLS